LAVTLTASFGVATFPRDGASQEELIRVADQAMYRVKAKARDGVASREA
jgi:diguanylate cyclase (GGDEF)-like protein